MAENENIEKSLISAKYRKKLEKGKELTILLKCFL